jgi:hypothetical protein
VASLQPHHQSRTATSGTIKINQTQLLAHQAALVQVLERGLLRLHDKTSPANKDIINKG